MKLLITVIVVFIITVYGYTYIHYKKKRTQSMDHVQEFHEKYKNKKPNINEAASEHSTESTNATVSCGKFVATSGVITSLNVLSASSEPFP